jgi:hypothetical protein
VLTSLVKWITERGGGSWGSGWTAGIGNVCGGGSVVTAFGRRGLAGGSGVDPVFGGDRGTSRVRILFSRFFWRSFHLDC